MAVRTSGAGRSQRERELSTESPPQAHEHDPQLRDELHRTRVRLLFHHLATVLKLSVMRWSLGARWRAFTRWQALQPRAETQWAVQLRAGQTALEAGASFDEVEQLLLTNGGRQAPLARATATELFRPPSPQPPSLRTTSPAAVDEQPPSMRSPPPAQSQPRSAHEQPHSHTALLSCRASPNRRRPAQVRRRSSERVGESSATSRGAAPLGGGHEMDTYLRSLSDQIAVTHLANRAVGMRGAWEQTEDPQQLLKCRLLERELSRRREYT